MPTHEELNSRFNDLLRKAEHLGRGSDRVFAEGINRSVNGKDLNQEIKYAQREMRKILVIQDQKNRDSQ